MEVVSLMLIAAITVGVCIGIGGACVWSLWIDG